MKIEIEVTQAEISAAIERKIRVAIADQTTGYAFDDYIKQKVKELWKTSVDKMVFDVLEDMPAMKAKVISAIETKLKAQIAAAMKVSK